MAYKMIRSFLPVGQGAFYVEQFYDGTNIVYDCGSSTDVKIVEKEIRSTFKKHEEISAVFISHLHGDHVNGLEYLLQYCNVKRVYLPLLTKNDILLAHLIFELENTSSRFLLGLLHSPARTIREASMLGGHDGTIIFHIIPLDSDNSNEEQARENEIESETIRSGSIIDDIFLDNHNKSYKSSKFDWVYIPFNFRRSARFAKLETELKNIGISLIDIKDVSFIKTHLGDIKKAYEQVPGKLNINSLVLYSGPRGDKCQLLYINTSYTTHYHELQHHQYFGRSGCLYTGDYDASGVAKWRDLIVRYQPYIKNIGTIQIPHHGSRHNYNPEFSKMNCVLIISAGYSNIYRHPHTSVLKDIILNHATFYWVTEQPGSKAIFEIETF